jgi:hypothetical protein
MQCFVLFCNVLHFICMLSGPDAARIYILALEILYQESLRAFVAFGVLSEPPPSRQPAIVLQETCVLLDYETISTFM